LNASGCWSSNKEQLTELFVSKLGGSVSKTCTLFSREGNKEPNYFFMKKDGIHFNSKGIPNLGYDYYKQLYKLSHDKPYILSITYESFDKLKILLQDYDNFVDKNVLVEINLSCPNTDIEIPGYNIHFMERLLLNLKQYNLKYVKFGFKLPPYFEKKQIENIAQLFNNYDTLLIYIVTCNSIPNCLPLENHTNVLSVNYGGMSGKINKHIALSNVATFSLFINKNISIVGCGGIDTIDDIIDYFTYGAKFVQLASCFYDETNNKLDIEKINVLVEKFINKN
jgi:dihydroorotate dehydrogenase (fumarate)